MKNKKALGLHWLILILAFIISLGIVIFSDFIGSDKVPKVGEFSVGISKVMEKNSITPEIIERFMEKINEISVDDLKKIEESLGELDNYCEDSYKDKIRYKRFMIEYGNEEPPERVPVHCLVNERNLKSDFVTIFNKNYEDFRPPFLEEDDVKYYIRYFLKIKDGEYLDVIQQRRGYELTIPINIRSGTNEKNIGEFSINPIFKFPVLDSSSVAYDFDVDGTTRERCVFSAGCATCQDVIDRYSERRYKIRRGACSFYLDCTGVTDAGGQNYRCGYEKLCEGACTPYCSSDRYTEDKNPDGTLNTNTNCRDDCSKFNECEIIEGTLDSCYCKDSLIGSLDKCTGTCLPYCSDPPPNKREDSPQNTNCVALPNPCRDYYDCSDVSSLCTCSDSTDRACVGSCPPQWCPSIWSYGNECGEAECEETEVLKTRMCMPAGSGSERECEYNAECDPCERDPVCCENIGNQCGDCGMIPRGNCAGDCLAYGSNCEIVDSALCCH